MSFLSMSVEPMAGAYLPDVLKEMQVLSNRHKCKVKTIFNGDEYVVTPK
jgi:hypothetical protein